MWMVKLAQSNLLPDWLIRFGIRIGIIYSIRQWYAEPVEVRHTRKQHLIKKLRSSPIAIETEQANVQHYELPTRFFEIILGSRLKYSCCYWPDGVATIDEAEEAMLQLSCERAQIVDGMRVTWKTSINEPSDIMGDTVYELVFGQNGLLTQDWAGKKLITISEDGTLRRTE